jgi:resuscitation-promoting factor RpfB
MKKKLISLRKNMNKSFKRRHPFVIPVLTLCAVVFLGGMLSVALNGQTVGASDTRVVKLYVDSSSKTIPTRARTVGELLSRLNLDLAPEDLVEPVRTTEIVDDNMSVNIYRAEPILVQDSGRRITMLSALKDPRKIVEAGGLVVSPEDIVSFERPGDLLKDGLVKNRIVILRAKTLTLNLYGQKESIKSQKTNIAEILSEKNITLANGDTMTPALGTEVTNGLEIVISRFGTKVVSEEQSIAFATTIQDDTAQSVGVSTTMSEGVNGKKVVSYEIQLKNNQEVGKKIIQETIVLQPVAKVVLKGSKALPVAAIPVVPTTPNVSVDDSGINGRVFCGSPGQRNWKNINTSNAALGRQLAAAKGWTGGQFTALVELWACESSWTTTAGNPYSGAYGIPQSLPASKMATFGADYATNPTTQILWGLNYIAGRYGTPSAALAQHYRANWY